MKIHALCTLTLIGVALFNACASAPVTTSQNPAPAPSSNALAPAAASSPAAPARGASPGASQAQPMFASQGKKLTIPQGFIIGADVSWVPQDEAQGVRFMDKGQPMDVLQILKSHGFNYARLRVFVDPTAPGGYSAQGFCDLAHTIAMAQRAKAAGMGVLLDFHYSDTWADPGKQTKPLAWRELDFPALVQKVHDYSKDVVAQMKAAGATPDMVQIGNEITPGMLLNRMPAGRGGAARDVSTQPEGSISNWDNLAALLKAGIAGVKEADPNVIIVLHTDLGGNNARARAWMDNALSRGVNFDIIALSCYARADWQGPPSRHKTNFENLVQLYPNLYFLNVEYGGATARNENGDLLDQRNGQVIQEKPAYARDGVDWTKREANAIIFGLPERKGLGTFIWEPTRNNNQQALFTNGVANTELYEYDQMAKDFARR